MSEDKTPPEWYDENKVTKAVFAFENGHSAYTGWVVDLGDGTCRFANAPLLGEGGPQWGDRVDLFYHPCSPFDMPMVGYRIYGEGEEPVGRHFGLKREPDEEEIAEHEEEQRLREKRECEMIERNFKAMEAPFKILEAEQKAFDERIRYSELKSWVKDQGLEVPDDLHEKVRERKEPTEEERKDTKIFLMAHAIADYGDIEVTDEEVQEMVKELLGEDDDDSTADD